MTSLNRERLRGELQGIVATIVDGLTSAHEARETGLAACRRVIRSSGSAIRAVHQGATKDVGSHLEAAEASLRQAQAVLSPYPSLVYAGFLHDAEKEYGEARLTEALVAGTPLPEPQTIDIEPTAWLRGLAEAASELRRNVLDELRVGDVERAEVLLAGMEEAYDALVSVDFPDALTSGLRRSVDALRAVLERTRGDVTTSVLQERLRHTMDGAMGRPDMQP